MTGWNVRHVCAMPPSPNPLAEHVEDETKEHTVFRRPSSAGEARIFATHPDPRVRITAALCMDGPAGWALAAHTLADLPRSDFAAAAYAMLPLRHLALLAETHLKRPGLSVDILEACARMRYAAQMDLGRAVMLAATPTEVGDALEWEELARRGGPIARVARAALELYAAEDQSQTSPMESQTAALK